MLGSTVVTCIAASTTTWDLSQAGANFVGEITQDQSGNSVASAGDGDGRDDLLIGARLNDQGDRPRGVFVRRSIPRPLERIGHIRRTIGRRAVKGQRVCVGRCSP